jgi:flagellar M-ring protein FliF
MVIDGAALLQWGVVALLLAIFYFKVIAPFAKRMLQIPVKEEPEPVKRVYFDEEDLPEDDGGEYIREMRRRVEKKLETSQADQEQQLKYEMLLEKLKETSEKDPQGVGAIVTNLAHGLDKLEEMEHKRGSSK